ncbi:MAG: hypothetical protein DRN27_02455 [Thermoplasmata archaeon]|nr:MAG: hypothetical protein DRN27_02455 [Thermoplasmata archaeon]
MISFDEDNENIISAIDISNRTWIVDNEGDGDFNNIQEAINAAITGDVIKIYSGTYYENIIINKENLNFIGIDFELGIGSDTGPPIIDGGYNDSCIIIESKQNSLTCLIIQHCANGTSNAGIEIHSNSQLISGNIFFENNVGIYIFESEDNNIIDNNISSNKNGIHIFNSNYNSISGNDIQNNEIGISLDLAIYNIIEENDIFSNSADGIFVNDSWYNTINGNFIQENNIGISLSISRINDVFENVISENTKGVYLNLACNRNNISNNNISDNILEGILVEGSSTNVFTNNILNHNQDGLICDTTTFNEIKKNTIINNQQNGLVLSNSNKNIIYKNTIICNKFKEGILLSNSNENNISLNDISDAGITFYDSLNNLIIQNNIENSLNGIYLSSSDDNLIRENTITLSNFDGIYLGSSFNNLLYHNFLIDNHRSAFDINGMNNWDNGYPDGGNYWSDYDDSSESAYDYFSGPDQDESFSDGIVDEPYEIPGTGSQDRYPLIRPWGVPTIPLRPQGSAINIHGKNYKYSTYSTDPNGDLIQYGWDWDGDKAVDEWTMQYKSGETIKTPHTWNEEGEYIIHVKAMDEHGGESDWSDPLAISIPKSRENNFLFIRILFKNQFLVWIIDALINLTLSN